jgi:hypothetical protein
MLQPARPVVVNPGFLSNVKGTFFMGEISFAGATPAMGVGAAQDKT